MAEPVGEPRDRLRPARSRGPRGPLARWLRTGLATPAAHRVAGRTDEPPTWRPSGGSRVRASAPDTGTHSHLRPASRRTDSGSPDRRFPDGLPPQRVHVGGTPVDLCDTDDLVGLTTRWAATGRRATVVGVNAHVVNLCARQPA
ncbi:hypothetical protein, partial [Actinocatenispora thailandica]|uniref:hypothetical protein n=1 Tax=Actinocatenispora thailandica TaxID=227318 RepID=UPI0031DD0B97